MHYKSTYSSSKKGVWRFQGIRTVRNELAGRSFATFGDGPVEMRETRKGGGSSIGVASDEVRGFRLNIAKRSRLIKAGANPIVPDFRQLPALLKAMRLA